MHVVVHDPAVVWQPANGYRCRYGRDDPGPPPMVRYSFGEIVQVQPHTVLIAFDGGELVGQIVWCPVVNVEPEFP